MRMILYPNSINLLNKNLQQADANVLKRVFYYIEKRFLFSPLTLNRLQFQSI